MTASQYPRRVQGYYVLGVLVLAYIVSYIDRTMLTLLVGPIRATLHISDLQLSLLHGFAFAVLYTLLGVPMGRIADRWNRRNLIIGGVLVWSLATVVSGFARNFWQMFGSRVGVGVGEATLSPAAYSILSDYFPPDKRSRVLAIFTSAIYLGGGIATLGGGLLIAVVPQVTFPLIGVCQPWQVIFILIGLLGLPVAVLLLTAHEPARRAAAKSAGTVSENYPFRTVMQFMWVRRAAYGPLILGISCYAMLTNGLKAWIPTFLMRTYGWAPAAVGLSFGFILLVFGTIGTVGGGYAASWLRQRGSDAANLLVGTAASLLIMPLCVIAPLMPSGGLALTFYAMAIFLAGVPFGTSAAAVQQITPNRMRGQVSAIYLFWLNLAGIGAGPIVVAFFTDTIFASDSALRYSLVCLAAISAPLAAILFKSAQASVAELIREQEY